jgi:DNA helicase-2/ATP-dependent DNA helicase PcrA
VTATQPPAAACQLPPAATQPETAARGGHSRVLLSPAELAARLGTSFAPTPEQAAVIGAPLAPAVVIAGAGSGKTETMAARVVWLVANGLVEPERILGLTFTRKAAGELQHRIRSRLSTLNRQLRMADEQAGDPTVLTYAAYAGQLVTEHAMLLGAEPAARLLTEAARWQVADSVVRNYAGEFTAEPGAVSSVTSYLLELAGQLADHLVDIDALPRFTQRLMAELSALPMSPRSKKEWPGLVGKLVDSLQQRVDLTAMLEHFADVKRSEGVVDFADQMVLATRLAQLDPVAQIERSRYDVVLLDEYQDTGHAQIAMLAALFADGRAVTAVGDPLQSIYGWRGASAGNIGRFAATFRAMDGSPAEVFPLMTSWRNDVRILTAANRIAADLRTVNDPVPAHRPDAGPGRVVISFTETEEDEARWLAAQFRAEWDGREDWAGSGRTLAVLVRKRSVIPAVAHALRQQSLPVEVVDLGGLLTLPEIADVVAVLRVLVDHTAGASLARILTGARWRVAPADLVALRQRARQLARIAMHSVSTHLAVDAVGGSAQSGAPQTADDDDRIEPSLVEALDDLGDASQYSELGYQRFAKCAADLRRLRRRLDLPLPDLLDEIERTIGLDIEVAARPGSDLIGRANLDRFSDEAARFAGDRSASAVAAGSSQVTAFLSYLKAAELEEYGLKPAAVEVHAERVQILTVHGAKGLEWDVVGLAGLVKGGFPSDPRNNDWTRARSLLPAPLRGDRHDLAQLDLENCDHRGDADKRILEHHDELAQRYLLEERRLGYVAFTRARRALYCSGATWGAGIKPREPSLFLTELSELGVDGAVEVDGWHEPDDGESNPALADQLTALWPADPLGPRRSDVTEGAQLVRAALATSEAEQLALPGTLRAAQWQRDVDLLLAERAAAARHSDIEVAMPAHLSVSDVVALSADEAGLARRLRRPVPQRPAKQARRGTAFHTWLEHRWSADTLLDIDELPGAVDEIIDDADLDALKAAFEASAWADQTPFAVEVPFEMSFGGRVVRGRMDAVFRDASGRYTVIDWKTGKPPVGADADAKAVQLALYRLAWAHLQGLEDADLDQVSAAFYYVGADATVAPADLLSAEQLRLLING